MDSLYPILAAVFVLALLGGALWLLRGRGPAWGISLQTAGRARQMAVEERVALGPAHALHLVRVGSRSVVIATSPGGCQAVMELGGGES